MSLPVSLSLESKERLARGLEADAAAGCTQQMLCGSGDEAAPVFAGSRGRVGRKLPNLDGSLGNGRENSISYM